MTGRWQRNWQFAAIIGVLLLMFAVYSSVTGAAQARHAATKAKAVAEQFKEQTAAANRASMIVANGQCRRLDDGRVLFRRAISDTIDIVFGAQIPGNVRSPQAQVAVTRLIRTVSARTAVLLHEVNCDKAAPLPPNLTDAERASLPKPTPIPALRSTP